MLDVAEFHSSAALTAEGMGLFRLRVKNGCISEIQMQHRRTASSLLQHDTRARTMTADDRHQYCRHIIPCSLRQRLPPCASLQHQRERSNRLQWPFELPGCEWPERLLGKGSGASVWSVRLPTGAPVDRFCTRAQWLLPNRAPSSHQTFAGRFGTIVLANVARSLSCELSARLRVGDMRGEAAGVLKACRIVFRLKSVPF